MPHAIQLIGGFNTAAGAGTTTVVASPGDSFAVAAGTGEGPIMLEQLWVTGATADFLKIFSPRMHDVGQGIRLMVGATKGRPLLPWGLDQPLYPADTPTVQLDATGAGTGAILALYEYMDLPGANQRLANWSDVQPRIEQVMGNEVDVTSSATIGTWGTSVGMNGTFDNFKAGRDYAILGYTVNAAVGGIRFTGPDTSNYAIGGPGDPDPVFTRDMFRRASIETGRPFIPIMQANNKATTLVQAMDIAASTAVKVTFTLALLK